MLMNINIVCIIIIVAMWIAILIVLKFQINEVKCESEEIN